MTETGVLDGVRIVEMADGIAGPVATMLLAAAGADVIKVEPQAGASTRGTPGFATWNRGKRSVVLDIEEPDGRARMEQLLAGADALVHDLLPGDAARLSLDDGALATRHPALVVCGITGYPIGHPDDELPASDTLVLARSGLFDEQAPVARDGPTFLRMPLGSWGAVYLAAAGVLARLLARERTGVGGPAHTSLLQGALVTMTMHWARAAEPTPAFAIGMPKDPAAFPPITPTLFECGDGTWIHLMGSPHVTPLMQSALAELGPDGVVAANDAGPRGTRFPDFGAYVVAFKGHDSVRWLEELWAHDVPAQAVVPMGALFRDDQANANGYVVTVDDPDFGTVRQAGLPFTTASPSSAAVRPAPKLGAHTDEVLAEERRPVRVQAGTSLRWPLEGLKVLDLGAYLAGPIAPMMLADLGADVIKVEPPGGDMMRFVERTFAGCQRGKRDIVLDLKNPAAPSVLHRLVAWADVVHHNLRLPAARKLGLGYDSLRAVNPALVYCHVSSYGPLGPRADWPGFDQLFQASSGWELEGAGAGNPPMWHRFGMMDHQAGMASLVATLLGLHHRARTGEGQLVTASLLGASLLTTSETLELPDGSLAPYAVLDHEQVGVGPGRRIIERDDGWIAVDVASDDQLGVLTDALRGKTVADALRLLHANGVPSTEVRLDQMDAFFDDDATWSSGLATRYPHARYGMVEQVGSLWSFGDLSARLDRASPEIGQHSREVLTEVGFVDSEIDALIDAGAVTEWVSGPTAP